MIILQKEEKQLVSEYYILDRVPGIYMVRKETYFLSWVADTPQGSALSFLVKRSQGSQ